MSLQFTTSFMEDSRALMAYYRKLGEGALRQVPDERLFVAINDGSNSAGVIVKHMAGNMLSRWTDFSGSDGEKPWRNRDAEFSNTPVSRETLMRSWDDGWACVFHALNALTDGDMGRTVMIKGEAHSVLQAVGRQLAHYAYHVGQIVLLAKYFQGADWQKPEPR